MIEGAPFADRPAQRVIKQVDRGCQINNDPSGDAGVDGGSLRRSLSIKSVLWSMLKPNRGSRGTITRSLVFGA